MHVILVIFDQNARQYKTQSSSNKLHRLHPEINRSEKSTNSRRELVVMMLLSENKYDDDDVVVCVDPPQPPAKATIFANDATRYMEYCWYAKL